MPSPESPKCYNHVGLLNTNPLASDPRAPAWLEQSIDAARDLGAGVILVAFFGKGNLLQDNQLKAWKLPTRPKTLWPMPGATALTSAACLG